VNTQASRPSVSVFPKAYFDQLCSARMSLFEWIDEAATLDIEAIEMYDGFFQRRDAAELDQVLTAMDRAGLRTSMLCFSPDFTHPDAAERASQLRRQEEAIDLSLKLGTPYCRTLSGQRHPETSPEDGVRWAREGIQASLEYAVPRGVTLCMENHYKDGLWRYPEFAQRSEVYLKIIEQIDSPNFGVQYDPSNSILAGEDPVDFLRKVKHRVVTMQASDRYLKGNARLQDLKQADGTLGYSPDLLHGEIGKGLNDYDSIFQILREINYCGWISVEDGVEGLAQMARSVEFLKKKIDQYYPVIAPRPLS
jgi:sugar phosphate isomerase/epimerase